MPYVDNIIKFMRSQQGRRIVIETDAKCIVTKQDGSTAPIEQTLNQTQLESLLREILPADQQSKFSSGDEVSFNYRFDGEDVQVEASRSNGALRVEIDGGGAAAAPAARPAAAAAGAPATAGARHIESMNEMFRLMKAKEASDLHLSSRQHPMLRVHGQMQKLTEFERNDPEYLRKILWEIAPRQNQKQWEDERDTDFAYELEGCGRFRSNIFEDRHGICCCFRLIPSEVVTCEQLGLTKAMVDLCYLNKGLVLVTGPTGCGKSTTLAAMVDQCNKDRTDHIITIEDPIEFVHENKKCLINQRQVKVHTETFSRALRAGFREDPDIILVGEMRDLETIAIAIETAETGHLVFGTLHTTTAASTVDRIIDQFPPDQQEQIRTMLSESLKAVISQALLRTKEGRRTAAFEVLLVDPACANLIRENKTFQLNSMMQIGKGRGCQPMNDSIIAHVKAGRVDPEEAYSKAVDRIGLIQLFDKEGIRHNIKIDE